MKRIKPTTSSEADLLSEILPEIKEKLDKYKSLEENIDIDIYDYKISLDNLPSKGKSYPKNSIISYSPLTYGEVKYLSNSDLTELDFYKFYLNKKIKTSFNKNDLTFFDFVFIIFIIRLSVFGDNEITINYECEKCGIKNKERINLSEIDFFDISVNIPVEYELNDEKLEFYPLTIGDYIYLETSKFKGTEDYENAKIAKQIKNKEFNEALKIVKEKLNGVNVNILETMDTILYHGPKKLKFVCKKEGCGNIAEFPFYDIYGYAVLSDTSKKFFRDRINITI